MSELNSEQSIKIQKILKYYSINIKIQSLKDCTPSLWISICQKLFNHKIEGLIQSPELKFHHIHNMTVLRYELSLVWLDIDIPHISPEGICMQNIDDICNLIDILYLVFEHITKLKNKRKNIIDESYSSSIEDDNYSENINFDKSDHSIESHKFNTSNSSISESEINVETLDPKDPRRVDLIILQLNSLLLMLNVKYKITSLTSINIEVFFIFFDRIFASGKPFLNSKEYSLNKVPSHTDVCDLLKAMSIEVLKIDISYIESQLLYKKDSYMIILLSELFINMFQVIFKLKQQNNNKLIQEINTSLKYEEENKSEDDSRIDEIVHKINKLIKKYPGISRIQSIKSIKPLLWKHLIECIFDVSLPYLPHAHFNTMVNQSISFLYKRLPSLKSKKINPHLIVQLDLNELLKFTNVLYQFVFSK